MLDITIALSLKFSIMGITHQEFHPLRFLIVVKAKAGEFYIIVIQDSALRRERNRLHFASEQCIQNEHERSRYVNDQYSCHVQLDNVTVWNCPEVWDTSFLKGDATLKQTFYRFVR